MLSVIFLSKGVYDSCCFYSFYILLLWWWYCVVVFVIFVCFTADWNILLLLARCFESKSVFSSTKIEGLTLAGQNTFRKLNRPRFLGLCGPGNLPENILKQWDTLYDAKAPDGMPSAGQWFLWIFWEFFLSPLLPISSSIDSDRPKAFGGHGFVNITWFSPIKKRRVKLYRTTSNCGVKCLPWWILKNPKSVEAKSTPNLAEGLALLSQDRLEKVHDYTMKCQNMEEDICLAQKKYRVVLPSIYSLFWEWFSPID